MKVYLAGPMTGIPQFNIPAFDHLASVLRADGYEVISPAELDDPEIRAISLASEDGSLDTITSHGQTHGDFLARDVKLIADDGIEAIIVLPGWDRSPGARHETFVAYLEGLPIYRRGYRGRLEEIKGADLAEAWMGDRAWEEIISEIEDWS